ncbi:MAG: hypothetical protein ABSH22_11065 [Tepidisphaeraceae bacterium]|jgi:hypothetical protein
MESFEDLMARGGSAAIQQAASFFMGNDPVHLALRNIHARLAEIGVSHAIAGGMAVVAHGYGRTTEDVDILVTPDGLKTLHEKLDGLGYVPLFSGGRDLRDAQTGVRIEFLVTGQYPGDGKPKPVAFPDPDAAAVDVDEIPYLRLPVLIELKLASGMTNPGRLKDLSDVQEIIRRRKLPAEFGEQLNPYVRGKYAELWGSVQGAE